jgi:hypothetical protein
MKCNWIKNHGISIFLGRSDHGKSMAIKVIFKGKVSWHLNIVPVVLNDHKQENRWIVHPFGYTIVPGGPGLNFPSQIFYFFIRNFS